MSSKLRVAHLADTHLGYRAYNNIDMVTGRNQRSLDFERSFDIAIIRIIRHQPDLVVHGGDVFHHPRPDWRSIEAFIEGMRRLENASIPTVVISGNHDVSRNRTVGSVYDVLRSALPKIRFYDPNQSLISDGTYFESPDVGIICLPHGPSAERRDIKPPETEWKILLSHGGIANNLTPPQLKKAGNAEMWFDPEPYDYVALGDHHISYRSANKTWYSGSTERCGFSDEKASPGFLIVDLEKDYAPSIMHHDIPCRPMKTLPAVQYSSTELAVADAVERVRDWNEPQGLCRVSIDDAPRGSLHMLQRRIDTEVRGTVWKVIVYTGATLDDMETSSPLKMDPDFKLDIPSMFRDFVASRKYDDPEFGERLLAKGSTALAEAAAKEAEELEQG